MRYTYFLIASLLSLNTALAQNQDTVISEKVFTITESYKFRPDEVVKTPFHAEIDKDTIQRQHSVNFTLEPQSLYYPYLPLATNPLAYHDDQPRDSFRHYVKLGYGNYAHPLIKTGFTLGKNPQKPFDINFLYDQSKGKERLQNQRTITGDVYVQLPIRTTDNINLSGSISSEKRNLFGVPDFASDSLPERYIINNWLFTEATLNYDNANVNEIRSFHFQPSANLSIVRNSFQRSELRTNLLGHFYFPLSRKVKFDVMPFLKFQSTRSEGTHINTIAGVSGATVISTEGVKADVKLEFNTLETPIFGGLKLQVPLKVNNSYFQFSAGRDYIQNSLRSVYTKNNFIQGIDDVRNTIQTSVAASFHMSPHPVLDGSLFLDYSGYDDYLFFRHTTGEANNYFDVQYTDGLNLLTFGTEFKIQILEKYKVYAKLVSYNYNQDVISDRITYIPGFEARMRADLPIIPKLNTYFTALFYSGRYDFVSGQVRDLKSYLDLGLGATYELRNNFKLWLDIANLANRNLDYYFHYPSIGRNFRGGILYLF